jgi:hypothetical protein
MMKTFLSNPKYHNKKVIVDGIAFDSKKEARRWCELKLMEKAGVISDLERQVEYELIPSQREPDIIGPRGGVKKDKVIELDCTYIADFRYKQGGEVIVEDTKGFRTADYIIKRKLMLWRYGIRIKEV